MKRPTGEKAARSGEQVVVNAKVGDRKLSRRFAARFFIYLCFLYAFSATPWVKRSVNTCAHADAHAASTLLRWLGQNAQARDSAITGSHFAIMIVPECTASEMVWLLVAGVCAFPTTVSRKLGGVVLATCAISAVNLIRITSVFLIGVHRSEWFVTAHEEIWAGLNVLALVAIAVVWILWATRDVPEHAIE